MNDALTRESLSSRQRVLEAYRGQLRLVRSRLDPVWRAQSARLNATGNAEQRFERMIAEQLADGAILLSDRGAIEYPDRRTAISQEAVALERELVAASAPDLADAERDRAVAAIAARLNDYS